MILNKTQINLIDKTLEKSGVVYIDYKFEILDHIASEIEEIMGKTAISFEDVLAIVLDKWSPKFKKSIDVNFGLIWSLPEILQRKAKKIYWKKMLKLFTATAFFTPILLFFKDFFSDSGPFIFNFICAILIIQLIGYLSIIISKQKTTFGFLYKQQFLGLIGLYIIPLYSLNSNSQIFERPISIIFPLFFMIAFLVLAPIANFNFLKEHFSQLDKNRKFI